MVHSLIRARGLNDGAEGREVVTVLLFSSTRLPGFFWSGGGEVVLLECEGLGEVPRFNVLLGMGVSGGD